MVARIPLFLATFLALTLTARTTIAEPIGTMERFALAPDRETMLQELIPGSEDYFFYHCLHYQTTGQLDQSEVILKKWLAEHKGRETPVIINMLDRQRLLTYTESPQRTIDYLVKRLGVQLNHAPPAVKGQRQYPSKLDVATLDIRRLVIDALRRNDKLKPVGMQHLADRFQKGDTAGLPINLQEFLKRVDTPSIEGLGDLVIKELKGRRDKDVRFGDLDAHKYLTLAELERVAKQVPQVADDQTMVQARLRRMRPSGDSDLSQQPEVRLDYLRRVEAYVRTLPPSYNSLKAAATFRLLEANLGEGIFDRELFERYLQLPRVSPIVHPDWIRRMPQRARLSDNFMDLALLPPVGSEQRLVRTYLEHFLKDAANPNAFSEYLQPEFLRRVFAETKLLYGVGNADQWYGMLSASERQAIRDAVQLRLAPQNRIRYDSDDRTALIIDIKNIDDLVVRIYEINTLSYYRSNTKPVDTDIDLDGLVATHEKKFTYNQPAVRRHRETIQLEEITGRGVWIVDVVGKGLRARALIRRGDIHHVASENADGMVFAIIDEARRPIAGATMLVGSREFVAGDDGRIVLTPIADRTQRQAIIHDGRLAKPVRFQHLHESYSLAAGMYVDRTQLQSGSTAEVMIRPRLTMSGTVIDPATLKDVSVRLEATDLDGIATTKQVDDIELDQNQELVVPLRVPARLASLKVTLSGKVTTLADDKQKTLRTSRSWDIAGIRRTHHTHDTFLTKDGADFVIEVRGRSGERVPRATVMVSLQTTARRSPVEQTLQSDDQGIVRLSPLAGVTQIRYGLPGGLQHTRDLHLSRVIWPNQIHTTTDRAVRLSLAETPKQVGKRYRLIEIRGGQFYADHSERLSIENGMLVIESPLGGDFHLIDRETDQRTQIVVVDGPSMDAVAVGEVRHQSMSRAVPLGIQSIKRTADGLRIQLSGRTELARVHLFASRYLGVDDAIGQLDLPLPPLSGRSVSLDRCGYISDLRLGDEYQYVLRRRYAAKFPGVMLPQPSVILNPWETEETTNRSQSVRGGDAMRPSAAAPKMAGADAQAEMSKSRDAAATGDYDFLADSGVILANLNVDADGVVTIPADSISGLPLLQIVVADAATVIQRTISAPLADTETIDLRLAKPLDAKRALTFQRAVSVVSKENPLNLSSLGSAQLQIYGDVVSLMKLYRTLVNDSRLAEFDVLASWHNMDRNAKLQAYSRLASHELHLFLWAHDRGFFDEVVAPYLSNKYEEQFIDDWLLDNDLSPYTQLWRYNQLNAAERALLAMRLRETRAMIRRQLSEVVEEKDQDQELLRRQIDSALSFGAMDEKAVRHELEDLTEEFADVEMDSDGLALDFSMPQQAEDKRRKSQPSFESRSTAGAKVKENRDLFGGRQLSRLALNERRFFQDLDSTKQWAESQWDRLRSVGASDPSKLIAIDPFWADLASCEPDQIRVSSYLLRPIGNRHSALVALAFCGLPLQSSDIALPTEADQPYVPGHPVAVVTKRLQNLGTADEETTILVGQRFAPVDEGSRNRKSDHVEEPKEFLIGIAYQGQTVISNPTAQKRVVDVFWQIPAGSIPLGGSHSTDSRTITLEPFAVQAIRYQFYFPRAGQFVHYPATVSADGVLLSRGNEKSFNVLAEPSEDDSLTWDKLVRSGTREQIINFLKDANLHAIDWMRIAHRMRDQEIYQAIIRTLGDAKLPIANLWAYSLHHRDESAMATFLSLRSDLVNRVGPVLQSPLLEVRPIERRMHEHLEYAPLVRARIHRLGESNEILNPTFLQQYRSFVQILGFQKEITAEDRLALSYYLLIQNRIQEAIETFTELDANSIATKLQHDYMAAYLAMHREQYGQAEKIARRYDDHPVPRWRQRFAGLALQLDQRRGLLQAEQLVSVEGRPGDEPVIEGSGDLATMDRERRQAQAATEQPEVIVRVDGEELRIDHRRAKEVTLNLYGVDLELLFSKAPFVREDLQRMAMVKPTRSDVITFDDADGVGRYTLDENLQRQTLLVEVVAGASRSTALYYGGELTTYVSESFGQLQTTDRSTHRPVSTAYVKVYGRYPDGSVRFYKDGYTDGRGRFDYASVSAGDAKGAERFAILVISEEKGATLHDVAPPNR